VGGNACRAGVVGGEFIFLRADLHGVDGALDVRAASGGVKGATCGVAVGGGVGLGG
jgi:hypothetical protein